MKKGKRKFYQERRRNITKRKERRIKNIHIGYKKTITKQTLFICARDRSTPFKTLCLARTMSHGVQYSNGVVFRNSYLPKYAFFFKTFLFFFYFFLFILDRFCPIYYYYVFKFLWG